MAEATSEVDICNSALTLFGEDTIIALDQEDSTAAKVCSQHYYRQRNATLRAFPWNFAMKRASLAKLSSGPAWGFANAFQLPSDCVRAWDVEHSVRTAWRVEGNTIVTDLDSVNLRYIAKITDPNQFDELFVDALAARLSATICIALTGKRTLATELWKLYRDKIEEAGEIDSQEGEPEELDTDYDILTNR